MHVLPVNNRLVSPRSVSASPSNAEVSLGCLLAGAMAMLLSRRLVVIACVSSLPYDGAIGRIARVEEGG